MLLAGLGCSQSVGLPTEAVEQHRLGHSQETTDPPRKLQQGNGHFTRGKLQQHGNILAADAPPPKNPSAPHNPLHTSASCQTLWPGKC